MSQRARRGFSAETSVPAHVAIACKPSDAAPRPPEDRLLLGGAPGSVGRGVGAQRGAGTRSAPLWTRPLGRRPRPATRVRGLGSRWCWLVAVGILCESGVLRWDPGNMIQQYDSKQRDEQGHITASLHCSIIFIGSGNNPECYMLRYLAKLRYSNTLEYHAAIKIIMETVKTRIAL